MAAKDLDIEALRAQSMQTEAIALSDWLVVAPIIVAFLCATLIIMMRQRIDRHGDLAMGGFLLMIVFNVALVEKVVREGTVVMTMGNWLPPFGIAFAVDTLGALFALGASIVGFLTTMYANADLALRPRRYGFFAFLLTLVAGVSGAFLTGDIFNLYVWFEVLLISSFGLIVFGGEREQLDGAVRYAVLNLLATTLFLIATGYLYGVTGTLNFADLARTVPTLEAGAPLAAICALFILAFAAKAAAFPVGFWLPASYHTPRPVVGALFAGLLTKVGVYAIIRVFSFIFAAPPDAIREVTLWAALATMLVGVLGALAQNDIRRALGFLVMSGIGSMLLGIALGTDKGLMGTVLYAVHSMMVMAGLYMACGAAQRLVGRYRLSEVAGLYTATPLLSALFLILGFAVAGLPPFSGFWPKVVLLQASLAVDQNVAAFVLLLTGLLTSITIGRIWALAFWRPALPDGTVPPVEGDLQRGHLTPLILTTALVVAIGIYPEPLFALAQGAAVELIDPSAYIEAVLGDGP